LVRRAPGRRIPGAVDGAELAVRAVLGQEISVGGARTLAQRLTEAYGEPLPGGLVEACPVTSTTGLTHAFPTAAALAAADPARLPLPRTRARALVALCTALATGALELDPGADRARARAQLRALPGIGPWTAD